MNSKILNAILSMDSYNRGYNAGVDLENDTTALGSKIGNFIVTAESNNQLTSSTVQTGFYAIAYSYNGETIISYRGTNDDGEGYGTDINHGYTIAVGTPTGAQAQLALDFYDHLQLVRIDEPVQTLLRS